MMRRPMEALRKALPRATRMFRNITPAAAPRLDGFFFLCREGKGRVG